jgi:hypothetical protein
MQEGGATSISKAQLRLFERLNLLSVMKFHELFPDVTVAVA